MRRFLKVHRSGYYALLREPLFARAEANEKLTTQIREFYDQSMGIYGSPRIFIDLKDAGMACSENRLARLMRAAQIKSVRGYKKPRLAPNNWSVNSSRMCQTKFGSRISPISAHIRVGCIWLPSWTCTHERLLAGAWDHTCGRAGCWMH